MAKKGSKTKTFGFMSNLADKRCRKKIRLKDEAY